LRRVRISELSTRNLTYTLRMEFMVLDVDAALQSMMSTQEILQQFKKVFGREMTTSERQAFFMPNQDASLDKKG
jgi:hypothetical protein